MNIYYYFFYKISGVLNKNGNNEWGPVAAITFFPLCSTIPFIVMLIPEDVTGAKNIYGIGFFLVAIAFYIFNTILFLNKKRCREIQKRFQGESRRSKRIGDVLVLIFIVYSIVAIFIA